jgi:hypothetical protein
MEILDSIKKVCLNKNFALNQLILFSICGILFLLFCKIAANTGFGYLLSDFYLVPSATIFEKYICLVLFIVGCIYLLGYSFKLFNSFDKDGVPDFDLKPFCIFLKVLPLIFTWTFYIIAIALCGIFLTSIKIISLILLCFIPFILINFLKFSKDLQLRKVYFSLYYFFKNVCKYFGSLIFYTFKFLIFESIVLFVLVKFYIVVHIHNSPFELALQLLYGCLVIYVLVLLQLGYGLGLNRVIEKLKISF